MKAFVVRDQGHEAGTDNHPKAPPREIREELKRLQIDVEESAHDMREEAREAARTISEERLRG